MLSDNIKTSRKSKGLSQDELAIKLNVVRQTVSKWERGLSVPDSEMLLVLSEILDTPVSVLLGENIEESRVDEMRATSEKLEVINLQLARRAESRRTLLHRVLVLSCVVVAATLIGLVVMKSPYLDWDYSDPERAAAGVMIHGFEWVAIRILPVAFIGLMIGIFRTRKHERT